MKRRQSQRSRPVAGSQGAAATQGAEAASSSTAERLDFELRRVAWGIKARASTDGESLDWYDDAKAYGGQLDAPEFIPAGSTMGRTPATPARGRRVERGSVLLFETNPLIYAA